MHKLNLSLLKTFLFCTAFAVASVPLAFAQENTSEEGSLIQDTIVVEYKFPGPPLWKVTNGENELLIFGVIQPIPHSFEWDPVRLERALERADLYLSAPRSQVKLRNPIRSIRALRRLSRMKKTLMADGLKKYYREIFMRDMLRSETPM